jgi:hypothetical protein
MLGPFVTPATIGFCADEGSAALGFGGAAATAPYATIAAESSRDFRTVRMLQDVRVGNESIGQNA